MYDLTYLYLNYFEIRVSSKAKISMYTSEIHQKNFKSIRKFVKILEFDIARKFPTQNKNGYS